MPPGTWSDDGAQALCLLASLLLSRQGHIEDLMRRLLNWLDFGYMAIGGKVFDAGGLAGLRDCVAAIPRRWLDGLRDAAAAKKLVDRLLESAASRGGLRL